MTAIGQPELAADPRFCDNSARNDNHAAIKTLIEAWAADRQVAEIIATLQAHDVPCSAIASVAEAAAGAQVTGRGLLRQVRDGRGRTATTMARAGAFAAIRSRTAASRPASGRTQPRC